jgi:hypothetical protein
MPTVNLTTYKDLTRHLIDHMGASVEEQTVRDCRRAIQSAYREFANAAKWSYYYQNGQITTSASQTSSTITYDHTGGVAERLVTIAAGTWPSWAAYGHLVIDNVPYRVATRESSTTLTLSPRSNPGADVAAGTSYTLYRNTYPLPLDFISADQFISTAGCTIPRYCHPSSVAQQVRLTTSPATPRHYSFIGDENYVGSMAVLFWPPPDAAVTYDFMYQRRPRALVYEDVSAGTVSVTGASAVVTGSGTAFQSAHEGSVLRISPNATDEANSLVYETPFAAERLVTTYTSATQLTVDSTFSETLSGVKYSISDPVDIEDGVMLEAFLRCCEKQGAIQRVMKNQDEAEARYIRALKLALSADSRNSSPRLAGVHAVPANPWKNMPLDLEPES